MKYKPEIFMGLMGKAEMEWLFHALLEAADDDLVIKAWDMPAVLQKYEEDKHLKGTGAYYLCWLIEWGAIKTVDTLASPRYVFKLIIPDTLKAKLKDIGRSTQGMNEVNWCDTCRTPIAYWDKIPCFIPQPDQGYGPHPRPDDWGKVHRRTYVKNDGTCYESGCKEEGFPYCAKHDSP